MLPTAKHEVTAPNLIKIDVEGAEQLVFQGLSQTLRFPFLRVIIFEDSAKSHDALVAQLKEWDFSSFQKLPGKGQANYLASRG
jgi:Methyltransferase FkbM domain